MPAYNAAEYIEHAIGSVLNQNWDNWELIVVNDGSTDNTESIVNAISDDRIKYLYQENQGVSAARNKGLDLATGDFLVFLDADDSFPSNSLKSRVEKLIKHREANFCDGIVNIYDHKLKLKQKDWHPNPDVDLLNNLLELNGNVFFGLTWMIRNNGNSNIRFKQGLTHGEDLLYFIEHALDGGEYLAVNEPILNVRRGHSSAMSNLDGLKLGYEKIWKSILSMPGISKKHAAEFRNKTKSIMFKSYISSGRILSAFKVLFEG